MKRTTLYNLIMVLVISLCMTVGAASGQTLIFQDTFDAGLASNWTTGTNTAINSLPAFSVENGKLVWHQGWDYIESVTAFTGNFRVEVDVERPGASVGCKDFSLELVNVPAYSGAFRFQYGTYAKDSIVLGQAPNYTSRSAGFEGACIQNSTSSFLREMPTVQPHTGTMSLTYLNGQVIFSFMNSQGQSIQTPAATVGAIGATKIRIAATASQLHYVSAVRVYSLDDASAGDCSNLNLNNFSIEIPCIMVGGKKYRLNLLYDPAVPGGIYWKLDINSLQEVTN